MKASILVSLLMGLAAGGVSGYFYGRGGQTAPGPVVKAALVPQKEVRGGQELRVPDALADLRSLLGEGPLTAENAGGRIERALAEPDALRRQAAVSLLLLSMDASSARSVMQGFRDITVKTGRTHDADWALMLKRFGQVLGADGIKELMAQKSDARMALEGLASIDPAAARAALGQIDPNDPDMRSAFLKGLANKDPGLVFSLILTGEESGANAASVMKVSIQSLGLEATGEALRNALGTGELDKESIERFQTLFTPLTDAMFIKHWQAGTVDKMLTWLEKQKGEPYITGDIVAHGAKDAFLSGKPERALDLLTKMNEGNTGKPIGGKELQVTLYDEPKILANMEQAVFERVLKFMPENPQTLMALGISLRTLNSERARQIEAIAQSRMPLPASTPSEDPQ